MLLFVTPSPAWTTSEYAIPGYDKAAFIELDMAISMLRADRDRPRGIIIREVGHVGEIVRATPWGGTRWTR